MIEKMELQFKKKGKKKKWQLRKLSKGTKENVCDPHKHFIA